MRINQLSRQNSLSSYIDYCKFYVERFALGGKFYGVKLGKRYSTRKCIDISLSI